MGLNIQYASDLHIEFPQNRDFLKRNPLKAVGDVLVLAGDIVPFWVMDKHKDFFSYLSDHFETTYWLPGNHEFYHFDIAEKSGVLNEKIRNNVFLVNNTSVLHGNVRLIFSTLWSKISPGHQWHIERNMNDFHLIKHNGFRFSTEHYNQLHEESLGFLMQEIDEAQKEKIMVFTHHCPTFLNYPEQYKGDVLNEAFAVELYGLIESSNIDYWVYGHHHTNTPEFNIGRTKLLTNQLGYVQQNEHRLFERDKCIINEGEQTKNRK
ncbi:metallophosphoesterase [Aquiflexum sp.]|uniref:metallophosphoesterase n=1 Tax=Aquiflexum sp. TaxID=1872584 RepID=UPI003593F356